MAEQGYAASARETAMLSLTRYSLAQRNARFAMARASVPSVRALEKDKGVRKLMKGLLWAFMPDGVLPVLIVFTGLALILGIVTRKAAFSFVGILILLALFTPFIESLFDSLPWWVSLLFMAAFVICIIKAVMHAIFGRAATAEFMGHLMYDIFLLPFRLLGNLIIRRRGRLI